MGEGQQVVQRAPRGVEDLKVLEAGNVGIEGNTSRIRRKSRSPFDTLVASGAAEGR
jgi:hypothetical protein